MSKPTTDEAAGGYHKKFTGCLVDPDGVERHFINGAYGREGDLPSVIYPNGTQCWYIENPKRGGFGQFPALPHRIGGPAVIRGDGSKIYYQWGKLHRPEAEGPAMDMADGTKKWFENDKCLRFELPGRAAAAVEEEEDI